MTTEEKIIETPEVVESAEATVVNPQPKNVDALMQSTARFTRQGWDVFLTLKDDLNAITYRRIQIQLTSRSETGALALQSELEAISVPAVKVNGNMVSTITTFAKLQHIIKHADLLRVDLTLLD